MNAKWYCAIWLMIWLVLSLPVVSAQQLLTIQKFAGRDNVNGFARENDELMIQALAQMLGNPTPDVARQRARVYNADTYTFMDTCTAQPSNYYQCTYKTTDIVSGGTDEYAIRLYDSANDEIAAVQKTLTVDFLGPSIVSFSITPNMTTTAVPMTITYKAEDYGTETGQLTNCAGIKLINITANSTVVGQISADVAACSKEGTFTFTPTVQGQSARITVCATAIDHLNHKSLPACRDIIIDSQKPTATALELRDTDGFLITHARSTQPVLADVFVRIPDVDVNPTTIYADLSKLNPGLGKVPRDDQSGSWFIWRNVQVTTPSTCQVTVEATDFMGNKDTKTLTCAIGVDDTAPVVTEIAAQFVDEDGMPILGVNGTIFAQFTEAGSGLDKGNAFMDLRGLGLGPEAKANTCAKTGTETWKCSWNVRPTVPSGTYAVKVLPTTRDDLNNQLGRIVEKQLRFDSTAPAEIRLVEIAAFRGQQRVRTNVTSLGETLEFVVQGAGFTTAVADFTDLGGTKDTPAEGCTGNLTKQCTFAMTVAVSGPQPTNISFVFTDIAGNRATLSTTELFILGISNETMPNYWNISATCSPGLLDRSTLSVFEHPVYCRLKMSTTNVNARPITVQGPLDAGECTGQTEYISELNVENNYAGSTEPYLVFTLVATDYAINNLSFTCPMSTLTRVGNFMPQNLERDNATVSLQFYNLPLGEITANIDDEVQDVEDKIDGVWKTIGTLRKFSAYAEKLCQILNMIMTLIVSLTMINYLLSLASLGFGSIPVVGNILLAESKNTQSAICNPTETLRQYYETDLLRTLKKFCDFVTCQAGLFDLLAGVGVMSKDAAAGAEAGASGWYYDWLGGEWLTGTTGSSLQLKGAVQAGSLQEPGTYLNVKDSLIMSIIIPPLCIPGIIYNLDKWRQIQCRYGVCLLEDVRKHGLPASVCKDQKSYMQCRFVVGEIFNLIPFAPIVSYYLNIFQNILSDPLVFVSVVIGRLLNCQGACTPVKNPGTDYYICAFLAILSQLGKTIDIIKNYKTVTDFGEVGDQWCVKFEDAMDEYGG
jgi:hypothetical protein